MAFTFTIDMPKNLNVSLTKITGTFEKNKDLGDGNVKHGIILADGVEGKYIVSEKVTEITITKNPYI